MTVCLVVLLIVGNACQQDHPRPPARAREAAVAGMFYPQDRAQLSQTLDGLLAGAEAEGIPELKALICPHAGYQFSGPVAATGYRLLRCRDFRTVVLLMPSHYAAFRGAYVSEADAYRTPLGDVPVAPFARKLAAIPPFTGKTDWQVQRPAWAAQSALPLPAAGADTPETWEHSGEVQVPFLQKVLGKFDLVPVMFGQVDPAAAARALAERLDDRTVVIASSDLSHYHPYAEARQLDAQCIQNVLALKTELSPEAACGAGPILTVVQLAKLKGWKARLLDYRNSGDTTGTRAGNVVGYATIAFYAPTPETYNLEERQFLLELARVTIREAVTHQRVPTVDAGKLPPKLSAAAGTFVTLTKHGQLRGCIGNLDAQTPLWQSVLNNAVGAALRDGRFPPVQTNELSELHIEVSVLSQPKPLAFKSPSDLLAKLRPHRDGVILQIGPRSATYLPQVWAQMPDKETFLNTLAEKSGAAPAAWKQPGTRVLTYQVEAFKEAAP